MFILNLISTLTFWNSLLQYFGLLRSIGQTRWLLAGLLCPMKCILARASSYTLRYIVFGALMHFWTLRLFESLYVCLDRLILTKLSIWVWLQVKVHETILVRFLWHGAKALAKCIYRHSVYFSAAQDRSSSFGYKSVSLKCWGNFLGQSVT